MGTLSNLKGEIFSIDEDGVPIGIIGWFEYGDVSDTLRLRYYGIVPSKRGNRYGEEAVRLLLEHLSEYAPEQYIFFLRAFRLNDRLLRGSLPISKTWALRNSMIQITEAMQDAARR